MLDVAKLIELLSEDDDGGSDFVCPFIDTSQIHVSDPPGFEILPREYLSYAEVELAQDDARSRINCITHLKRALECQIDTFLHAWCLRSYVKNKRMLLHAKLELLKSLGLLNARSVTRFNQIRNKVEHEYARPNTQDLDIYFDLVSALVAILERAVVSPNELIVILNDGGVDIKYFTTAPRITIDAGEHGKLEASIDEDIELFCVCFRILFLLADHTVVHVINRDTLIDRLKQLSKQ